MQLLLGAGCDATLRNHEGLTGWELAAQLQRATVLSLQVAVADGTGAGSGSGSSPGHATAMGRGNRGKGARGSKGTPSSSGRAKPTGSIQTVML